MRDILPRSIHDITGLPERAVFMVTFVNDANPTLVVKGENISAELSAGDVAVSVEWATKMMRNVNNPLVNSKRLSPQEWTEFFRVSLSKFDVNSPQMANLRNKGLVWTKMTYVARLTDGEFVTDDGGADSVLLKKLMKKFLVDSTWEALGKVVAVDCFNTNWDRFSMEHGGRVLWANRGNIMFANNTVIGLDAYFADRGDSNLNGRRLDNPGQGELVRLGLNVLKDRFNRPLFAQSCVRAVASEVEGRMKSIESKFAGMRRAGINNLNIAVGPGLVVALTQNNVKDIFEPFVNPFVRGLNQGATELRMYLSAKKAKYAQRNPQGPRADHASRGRARAHGVPRLDLSGRLRTFCQNFRRNRAQRPRIIPHRPRAAIDDRRPNLAKPKRAMQRVRGRVRRVGIHFAHERVVPRTRGPVDKVGIELPRIALAPSACRNRQPVDIDEARVALTKPKVVRAGVARMAFVERNEKRLEVADAPRIEGASEQRGEARFVEPR